MQRERKLQRVGVRIADSYSCDAAAGAADGLVRDSEPEKNDWRIGKQLSAVVQDELQARIGHRDDQVDPAAVILPLDVVLESQQRLFVGEEIGLQVLGEIVNRHVGADASSRSRTAASRMGLDGKSSAPEWIVSTVRGEAACACG